MKTQKQFYSQLSTQTVANAGFSNLAPFESFMCVHGDP